MNVACKKKYSLITVMLGDILERMSAFDQFNMTYSIAKLEKYYADI